MKSINRYIITPLLALSCANAVAADKTPTACKKTTAVCARAASGLGKATVCALLLVTGARLTGWPKATPVMPDKDCCCIPVVTVTTRQALLAGDSVPSSSFLYCTSGCSKICDMPADDMGSEYPGSGYDII